MPKDSDETTNIDEILAELKNETVEESTLNERGEPLPTKKEIKNPYKDKKNDESNTYEFSDDKDLSDAEW